MESVRGAGLEHRPSGDHRRGEEERVYYLLVAAIGCERVAELVVARRNARWALARGGSEFGRNHYPVMVALHTALLIGCAAEVFALHRPFIAWLGWPMLAVAVLSQALRWWCITALGRRWNTRVIVLPDAPLIRRGPYRWLHHPNYVAVVAEGLALPLIHSAWLTAVLFTSANAVLLRTRITVENSALGYP
jgi:methyltransferase